MLVPRANARGKQQGETWGQLKHKNNHTTQQNKNGNAHFDIGHLDTMPKALLRPVFVHASRVREGVRARARVGASARADGHCLSMRADGHCLSMHVTHAPGPCMRASHAGTDARTYARTHKRTLPPSLPPSLPPPSPLPPSLPCTPLAHPPFRSPYRRAPGFAAHYPLALHLAPPPQTHSPPPRPQPQHKHPPFQLREHGQDAVVASGVVVVVVVVVVASGVRVLARKALAAARDRGSRS